MCFFFIFVVLKELYEVNFDFIVFDCCVVCFVRDGFGIVFWCELVVVVRIVVGV